MRHNILFDTDIPDPDVIFHDGYYYLITTTMHFSPGGEILRSPDLKTWEHFSYVFSSNDTKKTCLFRSSDRRNIMRFCRRYRIMLC